MSTLALIPARGGSKGIPRKNVRMLAGQPLIAWSIQAALASARIDAVVVSTEDEEIAEVARNAGAEVPFMRPVELSADDTPGIEPTLHAIDMLPAYDAVLLLQPTSPLRTTADIDGILALAGETHAQAIVSVCEAEDHPAWMYRLGAGGNLHRLFPGENVDRRQDLPKVFSLNGAMYFGRTQWLRAQRSFLGEGTVGYPMSAEDSVDIDGPLDWSLAEILLAKRNGTIFP
ncbi:MAG: acylneuraminate cytidylyltransferase family protein [Sphingosinicella sp.]|nr:acylneuraminate cytidylyltransferase family protein [Sphingosinicella sp.]